MPVESQLVEAQDRLQRIVARADAAVVGMQARKRYATRIRQEARRRLYASSGIL